MVYLTQKTVMKNATTDGFTMLEKSSVRDPNLANKGTKSIVIGRMVG